MSSNIHDTDVEVVRRESEEMMNDLQNKVSVNECERKYSNLYKTSKTLFDMIVEKSSQRNFNKEEFKLHLSKMLSLISKIQNKQMSQNKASEEIGYVLAKKYIPQLKDIAE